MGGGADGEDGESSPQDAAFETKVLGVDPKDNLTVTLRKGPYGFYYQWGEAEGKTKPKRMSLPKGVTPDQASLEGALSLGALPRTIGPDPASGEMITAAIGRFGPYVKRGSTFASLTKEDDVFAVTLERALELFVISAEKKRLKTGKGDDTSAKPAPKRAAEKKAPAKKATAPKTTKTK